MSFFRKQAIMVEQSQAIVGRKEVMPISGKHYLSGHQMKDDIPKHLSRAVFGLGCFWGAERKFWELPGVYSTAVGYSAGFTENPLYEEVCSGMTGHNEVVLVFFDESEITYLQLLKVFWESHNPTQGLRQGNDVGSQYRSGVYTFNEQQKEQAEISKQHYQIKLTDNDCEEITTEIFSATEFYYAEESHQQYLAKNPQGYCGLGGTGISFELN